LASLKQVCKYYSQGNLVKYLKGLSKADAARVDSVTMIFEISKGMAYLHEQDVLHGDLKVRIPVVKPDPLVK
jgi:serine/threonine protein kinase